MNEFYEWGCPGERYGECENCGLCKENKISQVGQNLTYAEDELPF